MSELRTDEPSGCAGLWGAAYNGPSGGGGLADMR